MTSVAAASPTLDDRIQDLPQELQDIILEFTLESPSATVLLTKDYKPPGPLAISRKTRAKAATSYYNNSAFLFEKTSRTYDVGVLISSIVAWVKSLSREHRSWVKEVRVSNPDRGIRNFEPEIYQATNDAHTILETDCSLQHSG
ncbi:hypothetical protein Slin15195_G101980 [Septoria linicola]|uniref:Uncharacterized protein n=1 Tax=Septoria linicola TaxID=215465 RepID=A0A9Q9ENR2_9PEZI|nr:hypothetical protein Slin14017_G064980 [Septoria linicola]USW56879.1 hypothetical protein Slin15195_G101980 [Septoria linicola]